MHGIGTKKKKNTCNMLCVTGNVQCTIVYIFFEEFGTAVIQHEALYRSRHALLITDYYHNISTSVLLQYKYLRKTFVRFVA
jgi:hypothetical protein